MSAKKNKALRLVSCSSASDNDGEGSSSRCSEDEAAGEEESDQEQLCLLGEGDSGLLGKILNPFPVGSVTKYNKWNL